MKLQKIDDQIRRYYQGQRLPEEARARLKATLRHGTTGGGSRRSWMKSGIAAGFVAALAVAALWLALPRNSVDESPREIAQVVAQHAAVGHNERQELEFRVSRTAELRGAMRSLDFTPVEPALISGMNMRVIGARYTTIEGVMAAQIVYRDPKGVLCTLYQARPVSKLAGLPNGDHEVDGLLVSVWHEKGLLMVLARPA